MDAGHSCCWWYFYQPLAQRIAERGRTLERMARSVY
ncbi:MAG: cyclic lactone autoinducer peptide [Prolixibacteraceae bacterium]|nr:cyclic lactone autoinducer peptide [Prolixibacteraceae bacterium]